MLYSFCFFGLVPVFSIEFLIFFDPIDFFFSYSPLRFSPTLLLALGDFLGLCIRVARFIDFPHLGRWDFFNFRLDLGFLTSLIRSKV